MSIIKKLFGIKANNTRQDVIKQIVSRSHQDYMMTLDDMPSDERPSMLRIDVVLDPRSTGPELQKLHEDLREGQANDLYAELSKSKVSHVESVLPVRRDDGKVQFRVVYDARNPDDRKEPSPF